MKTLYQLTIIIALFSCGLRKNTYIAPLPNTPMFEGSKEFSANTAVSPTHIELQGAASVTKNIGFTAGRFYSGSARNSSELGINCYLRTFKKFFITSTMGWGETKIGYAYNDPIPGGTNHSNSSVYFRSLFVHPGIYYVIETEENDKVRIGASLKYSLNKLSNFFYREYRNVYQTNQLRDETIITALGQDFRAYSPMISIEYNRGVFSIGGHFGVIITSEIKARHRHNEYYTPQIKTDNLISQPLNYWPIISSFYIGLRL